MRTAEGNIKFGGPSRPREDNIVTWMLKALPGNSSVNRLATVEVPSMWSAPRNSTRAVFSAWSVPRLYNESVFAANSSTESRTKGMGIEWSKRRIRSQCVKLSNTHSLTHSWN
jgi:hypothetical protein